MTPTVIFSLVPHYQDSKDNQTHSELLRNSVPTGILIKGVILKAQLETLSRFLLVLTDDCPYEEGLHIYLLGSGGKIIDEVHLGQPYTPGIFSDFRVISQHEIDFSFFGNDLWNLVILDNPGIVGATANYPQVEIRWSKLFTRGYLKLTRIRP